MDTRIRPGCSSASLRGAILFFVVALTAACGALPDRFGLPFPGAMEPSPPVAATTGHLNVRSGPGMENRVLTVLAPETEVEILGEEGIWRRVLVEGRDGRPSEGWVSSRYLEMRAPAREIAAAEIEPEPEPAAAPEPEPVLDVETEPEGAVPLALAGPTPTPASEAPAPERAETTPTEAPERVRVGSSAVASGAHAAEIRPIRAALAERRFVDVEAALAILRTDLRPADPALASERGTRRQALFDLEQAAADLDRGRLERGLEALSRATAREEPDETARDVPDDPLTPFERVWRAHYEALALLLRGDERAIEAARRAMAIQEDEERALDERHASLVASLEEARERVGESRAAAVERALDEAYVDAAGPAEPVKSALRSPFPHYVAGLVQEIRSRETPALRDEALAAYALGLRVDPSGELFRRAVDDLSAAEPSIDDRLVHVLVAEGFVPEERTLSLDLAVDGRPVEASLPILERVPSAVTGVRLRVAGAKTEHRLTTIADLEAMLLRLEREHEARRAAAVLGRLSGESRMGGWLAIFGGGAPEPEPAEVADPGSWMLLPARFHAARLRLPRAPVRLAIELLGAEDAVLDEMVVQLDPTVHNLVYVRATDGIVTAHARDPDWFAAPAVAAAPPPTSLQTAIRDR